MTGEKTAFSEKERVLESVEARANELLAQIFPSEEGE
jgi:hypothetical protein